MTLSLSQIERALDGGYLYLRSLDGSKQYLARRAGRTRTWKRDPSRFRIPVRYAFRSTYAITEDTPSSLLHIQA